MDKYIRLLYSKGEDFFHSTLVSEFVNFRLRKSLDWSNVTLKDTNLDIRKNGFHPINKEAARVELRFTDGNRTTSYRLNAIHLPSGWKYFYIK